MRHFRQEASFLTPLWNGEHAGTKSPNGSGNGLRTFQATVNLGTHAFVKLSWLDHTKTHDA